jgi:hypothetical protein
MLVVQWITPVGENYHDFYLFYLSLCCFGIKYMIWIKCDDLLKPKIGVDILLYHQWLGVSLGSWDGQAWWWHHHRRQSDHVTHWCAFEPPKS